jgi:hypothetical protein
VLQRGYILQSVRIFVGCHKSPVVIEVQLRHVLPCQAVMMEVWGHILICQDSNDVNRDVSEQSAAEGTCKVHRKGPQQAYYIRATPTSQWQSRLDSRRPE